MSSDDVIRRLEVTTPSRIGKDAASETPKPKNGFAHVTSNHTPPSSTGSSPRPRKRAELDELQDLGDWANIDTFEWDETDVTLSTAEGLRWLQSIGIVSRDFQPEDLSAPQRNAVDRLLVKLHERHGSVGAADDPKLTADALQKDEAIKENVQEVITLLGHGEKKKKKTQEQEQEQTEAEGQNSAAPAQSSRRPDYAVSLEHISEVTERLNVAWQHALQAKRENKVLERETSQLLLMSRARLQAEIIVGGSLCFL